MKVLFCLAAIILAFLIVSSHTASLRGMLDSAYTVGNNTSNTTCPSGFMYCAAFNSCIGNSSYCPSNNTSPTPTPSPSNGSSPTPTPTASPSSSASPSASPPSSSSPSPSASATPVCPAGYTFCPGFNKCIDDGTPCAAPRSTQYLKKADGPNYVQFTVTCDGYCDVVFVPTNDLEPYINNSYVPESDLLVLTGRDTFEVAVLIGSDRYIFVNNYNFPAPTPVISNYYEGFLSWRDFLILVIAAPAGALALVVILVVVIVVCCCCVNRGKDKDQANYYVRVEENRPVSSTTGNANYSASAGQGYRPPQQV